MAFHEKADIKIIEFHPRYRQHVLDLIVHIQRNEFNIQITADEQPDLSDIENFYQIKCGNFWVAVVKNRVVGTIALLDIGNHEAALRKMFVNETFRGKDLGVAEKLLKRLLLWSKEKEIKQLFLGTTPKFLAAHRFYEKTGFMEVSLKDLPQAFPVMKVDTKFYRYKIT